MLEFNGDGGKEAIVSSVVAKKFSMYDSISFAIYKAAVGTRQGSRDPKRTANRTICFARKHRYILVPILNGHKYVYIYTRGWVGGQNLVKGRI